MIDQIMDRYPDDTFLKADGFDEAIIGIDEESMRLIYSVSRCIKILERTMTTEEAVEHFRFNVSDAYMGDKTPIWCEDDYPPDKNTLADDEVLKKILFVFINDDNKQMLLQKAMITSEHNGVSYQMVRLDLALRAMRFIADNKDAMREGYIDDEAFVKSLFGE